MNNETTEAAAETVTVEVGETVVGTAIVGTETEIVAEDILAIGEIDLANEVAEHRGKGLNPTHRKGGALE
jgi:hypothetical protein